MYTTNKSGLKVESAAFFERKLQFYHGTMSQATDLEKLQDELDYRFQNKELLFRALVHRSFAYENQDVAADNETLEFLGDSVLGLAISHLLLDLFPDFDEGELSRLRSSIVNERELGANRIECQSRRLSSPRKRGGTLRRTAETFAFG